MAALESIARRADSFSENMILRPYPTVENRRPRGSAGNRPVKYSHSTALFNANPEEAPANIKSMVSPLPHIFLTIDSLSTKYSFSILSYLHSFFIIQQKPYPELN